MNFIIKTILQKLPVLNFKGHLDRKKSERITIVNGMRRSIDLRTGNQDRATVCFISEWNYLGGNRTCRTILFLIFPILMLCISDVSVEVTRIGLPRGIFLNLIEDIDFFRKIRISSHFCQGNKVYILICELHSMSKIFILVLLTVFLIPAGVFAAASDSPLVAINATGGTCGIGTGAASACGIASTGADTCSCGSGGACDCGDDCSCGMMGGTREPPVVSCCGGTGDNPGTVGTTGCSTTGGLVSGCGMLASGTANGSCGNGGACDCGDDCSCGMMGGTEGTYETSCCGATGNNQGILGTGSCPMAGMMGGSWGQATAGEAGRSGWAALGFILIILLIIIWIIVGILLIFSLYRKLSTK